MQHSHFDLTGAHPLRRRSQLPVRSRVGAIAAMLVLHVTAIAGLAGWLTPKPIIDPAILVVSVPLVRPRPVEPPPAPPLAPSVIDAIVPALTPPVIVLNPGPSPAAQAPLMLPSPPNASPGASNAGPVWETALLNRLAEAKHAPLSAGKGVVLLRFTMDRDGKVLRAAIEKSSGNVALDQEALAALQRAQPLPAPPAEVPGDVLDLIVPVDFL